MSVSMHAKTILFAIDVISLKININNNYPSRKYVGEAAILICLYGNAKFQKKLFSG